VIDGFPCHPIQLIVYIPDDMKVGALIDKITRLWNHELINACFAPAGVNKILSIPLSFNRVSDFVSWPFTKMSTFTVKSAYIMVKCKEAHINVAFMVKVNIQIKSKLQKSGKLYGV
jgi:hypothetical protein